MVYILVFVVAWLTAVILTPLMRWLSFRWGVVAVVGGRRQHQGPVAKLGSPVLLLAWLGGLACAYWWLPPPPQEAHLLRGVILGTLVIFISGLFDDWWELPARWLFLCQVAGAAIAIDYEIFFERFTNPFSSAWLWTQTPLSIFLRVEGNIVVLWYPLVVIITLFWVLLMMNAVNFLDGLDGLAAGVCAIAAALFAWHSYSLGQIAVPLFPLALVGALLGFLPYNFAPARIFLGSGAYLLGYQMATLSILSPAKLSTALLVLAVPILDVAWQSVARLRQGHSPFHGDRGHLHLRLSDRGLPMRRIVLGYYGVALAFGLVAVWVRSPQLKLFILGVLGTAVVFFFQWLSRRARPDSTVT